MVAIGAKLRFVSTLGERVIDAAGLYNDDGIDYLRKRPDELLVDIHLPPTNGWRASYQKLRVEVRSIFRCWVLPPGCSSDHRESLRMRKLFWGHRAFTDGNERSGSKH